MNILIVSPAYAPYAGVGSVRMMSFSKYLADKGHRVIVLRNAPCLWPPETLKSSVPEYIEVIDVMATGDFHQCVNAYYVVLRDLYESRDIDVAVYSCNPYYTIVAATRIKKECGAKFVIDFRDLWIKDEALTRSILRKIKKFLVRLPYRKYERLCIEAADAVVTVSPRDNMCLQKQYKQYAEKMNVIYNGYDEQRISNLASKVDNDKIAAILEKIEGRVAVGVFGKFGYYDYDYVCEMLKAVKSLNETGIETVVVHIGDCDKKTQMAMENVKFPKEYYIGTGYLDYVEGMQVLSKMDMNCLIVHYKRGLGTKLFDYIYLDKPVVYFAQSDSAIADVLKACKNAFICGNSKDAEEAIGRIVSGKICALECNTREMYSRQIQNENYEKLICNL